MAFPTALAATGPQALAYYGLAAVCLLVVLTTTDSMGVVELIPYRLHGWPELVSGAVFIASPFPFHLSANNPSARLFCIAQGAALVLWWLTDWSGKAHSETQDGVGRNLRGQPLPAPKHRPS